jgi:16S rRNA (cytosine967-C5)-methyltransferase
MSSTRSTFKEGKSEVEKSTVLLLAAKIVQKSSKARPADAVLRDELKASHGLSREAASEVSRAVFAHFRWRGWLDLNDAPLKQIQIALELEARFKKQLASFSDAELVERAVPSWVRAEMEVTAAWARALQAEPRLWLRARKGEAGRLAARLSDCRVHTGGASADAVEYLGRQDLFRTAEFQSGLFEVQDISSQAVGLICAPRPGEAWWDACAGEGGKLLHLSDLMQNRGLIWASDRAEWRLKKLQRRTARARVFNYRARLWDGSAGLPTKTRFDGVLVDAPCSGIGTWQRNPHARWTTTINDVHELAELQKNLLAHAGAAVKPGGKLVYSVCSLARVETVDIMTAFEAAFPQFKRLEIANPLQRGLKAEPHLFLRTEGSGGNGMFVAAWKRVS